MRAIRLIFAPCAFLLIVASACADGAKQAATPNRTAGIAGHVQTEYGLMLGGAQVCLTQYNLCVETDAEGYYALPYTQDMGDTVVIETSAGGFARRTSRLQSNLALQGPMVLRPVDKIA